MAARLTSLSAVVAVEDTAPDPALLAALGEAMARLAVDAEIVLVASGASSEVALRVTEATEALPDVTALFLPDRLSRDTARLVGMSAALGDWVLLATPSEAEVEALPDLVAATRAGYEIVVGEPAAEPAPRGLYALLARAHARFYTLLTGARVRWPAPGTRLLSRAAALYVGNHPSGEMLLRAEGAVGGFPAGHVAMPPEPPQPPPQRTRAAIGRGLRAIVAGSSMPLRLATAISCATGLLSLLYSLYVLAIYMTRSDVAAGWTTLSLQLAGMMFLFSVILGILSEYVIAIHHGLAPRRRHVVARELRSGKRRHAGRINVVDADGAFRVRAPAANDGGDAAWRP